MVGERNVHSVLVAYLMMCHYYVFQVRVRASAASLLNSIVTWRL
jgi:hypothetical protein